MPNSILQTSAEDLLRKLIENMTLCKTSTRLGDLRQTVAVAQTNSDILTAIMTAHDVIAAVNDPSLSAQRLTCLQLTTAFIHRYTASRGIDPTQLTDDDVAIVTQLITVSLGDQQTHKLRRQETHIVPFIDNDQHFWVIKLSHSLYLRKKDDHIIAFVADHNDKNDNGNLGRIIKINHLLRLELSNNKLIPISCEQHPLLVKIPRYEGSIGKYNRLSSIQIINDSLLRESKIMQQLVPEPTRYDFFVFPHDRYVSGGSKARFIMPHIGTSDLSDLTPSELSYDQKLTISKSLIGAIDATHRNNITHCDIKPDNIRIDKKYRATLIDFGLARKINQDAPHSNSTLQFAPPEVWTGTLIQDDSSRDIYALSMLLYQLWFVEDWSFHTIDFSQRHTLRNGEDLMCIEANPQLKPILTVIETGLAEQRTDRPRTNKFYEVFTKMPLSIEATRTIKGTPLTTSC